MHIPSRQKLVSGYYHAPRTERDIDFEAINKLQRFKWIRKGMALSKPRLVKTKRAS